MGMEGQAKGTIGWEVLAYGSVESTNKTAAQLVEEGCAVHGTVVMAREQTAGRGQRGRSWHSEPGKDLTCTLVLQPRALLVQDQYQLSQLVSMALLDVLSPLMPGRVRIKWPNDILVDRLKLAGMLIKVDVAGSLVQTVLAGVGINVNSQGHEDGLMATSLLAETGRPQGLEDLLGSICHCLDARWKRWEQGDGSVLHGFRDLLWARGRWTEVVVDGALRQVRPMDVDTYGRLMVEEEDGRVVAYGTDRLRFGPR